MNTYSVTVTWDTTVPVTVEALEALGERAGAAGGEPGRPRLEVTLTIEAPGPGAAADQGIAKVTAVIPGDVAAVEVATTDEADRRLEEPAFPELAGVTEISQILGVSRQRASAVQSAKGFPAPVASLASGPIYRRADLTRFEETWPRKSGRPPSWLGSVMATRTDVDGLQWRPDPQHPGIGLAGVHFRSQPVEWVWDGTASERAAQDFARHFGLTRHADADGCHTWSRGMRELNEALAMSDVASLATEKEAH